MKLKLSLILLVGFIAQAEASTGYFRSPAIHKENLVFTAEGDLWIHQLGQLQAKRLTTHPAEETQASISPDGKWVAYAANYEGRTEAYVISIDGGIAKRLSYENANLRVQGWTPGGDVLYSTDNRVGPTGNWTLKQVNPNTLESSFIPLADAVEGAIDKQGKFVYFTQFGLQVSNDNSKVYRGGAKGELWRFNLDGKKEAQNLTAGHQGSARQPMPYGNKLYFISDQNGSDNIWSMNLDGSEAKAVTNYQQWSVRSARLHNGKIAFQLGADIHILDLSNNKVEKQSIQLTSDFPNLRERWVTKPLKYLNSANQASDHEKVVITARGRVAIASTDKSRLVEVSTLKNSRTRAAILSHDGKWVYAINDASGETEIWRFSADGSSESKQLTKDGYIFRWQLSLSPDGKYIAHDDQNGDLFLLDLKSGKNKKILTKGSGLSPYSDLRWSPDSQLLAITQNKQSDERSRIVLMSVSDDKTKVLTSDKYNSYSPAFSADGNWLYFLSDRHFNANPTAPWGDRNMGTTFDRRTEIFAYALNNSANFPFQTPNELIAEAQSNNTKDDEDNSSKDKNKATLNWNGLTSRLWQVPVSSGNYSNLRINDNYLYVLDQISEPDSTPSIKSIKIEHSPKLETFADKVASFSLSDDGKKLFVLKQGNDNSDMFIVDADAKFPSKPKNSKVLVDSWKLLLNPKEEWKQQFNDAWLMHRDSLFDRNMRGVNWKESQKKYAPLLERLTDRYELNDIFSQMMGELNTLHSQIRGGDYPTDESMPAPAFLGATLTQSSKEVKIESIYQYDTEIPSQASPLMKPGVDAKPGDKILSINGIKINSIADVNRALLNQANRQVLLSLKRRSKTHKTIVVPSNSDYRLRYNDWVTTNRQKVEKSSNDIGYLHLHAMGSSDIADFAREFYAAYKKDGLIIDVRRNRGGNIDSWIIEKLLRKAWMFWQAPIGSPSTNMQQTFRGHLVVLADEFTYSDGETFTAGVKALKLAPVIGKQTAGAGVWLRGFNRLTDGGMARVAEFPQYSIDGRWIVEGRGVSPDIEINNYPNETFNGKDAQLDAAITYLKQKMLNQPITPLKPKPLPKRAVEAQDI